MHAKCTFAPYILIPVEGEEFYDVKTGLIARKNYFKNKTPLWANPQNGV